MIEHRSFIVAEIPEPVRSQVQAIRDSLNTLAAKLPVEITLAGSSGVGPIPAGTDLSLIKRHLDRTLPDISPFRARFSAIRSFPNTSIYFLEPFDRSPFDHLHQELRLSGIPFSEIRWPLQSTLHFTWRRTTERRRGIGACVLPVSSGRILDQHCFCLPTRWHLIGLQVALSANPWNLTALVESSIVFRKSHKPTLVTQVASLNYPTL